MNVASNLRRYGLATISCGLALALARPLDAPSSCFFLAIMASSLYGGKGPGLLSIVLSSLAFDYFFLPPQGQLYLEPSGYLRFAAFLGAAVLISALIEAKRRGEEARQAISARVQKSEAYLAEAQKLSHTGSFGLNTATGELFWSQETFRILGMDPSIKPSLEVLLRRVHPEDRDLYRGIVSGAKADLNLEHRLVMPDGTVKYVHVLARAERGQDGAFQYVGSAMDITAKVKAELDLRQTSEELQKAFGEIKKSEDQLRTIIDTIPTLAWSIRPDSSAEFFSKPWLDYTGLELKQAEGMGWMAAIHPDDLDRLSSHWRSVLASGEGGEIEARLRRANGAYRWFLFRAAPLRNESGRVVRWYGTNTDIEDRKHAEEALRARERDLALIVETIPALVWCASPEGDLVYVNERIRDYTGSTLDQLGQAEWVNFLHPDDVDATLRAWSYAVATAHPHDVQYRLRRFDGAYRWFHVVGQALRDAEGNVTRWYGLLVDIHDRKIMEEALRDTQNRLSRAMQIATVGELSASIAHEINQPLAAVVANGHACQRWLAAQPPNLLKAQEAMERVVRDGKEAAEVVRRIRTLFKRTAVERAALDLNELIGEVLRLLGSEAARRRVAVETDLAKDRLPLVGDRVQLQQLVLNLLLNGLEAMDPVVDRPKKLIVRSKRHDPGTVLVEIRDHGQGLGDPDKAFEAFFTTKENGMGMGLTICRSIVEAHEGCLWAAVPEGPGAVFFFTLPLKVNGTA